jgi:DNA methylase
MYESRRTQFLELSNDAQSVLIAAARDGAPVRGLTHGFYKYPARFSPIFAGAVIQAFTEPGDLVLDPHVGGGTTIVEALAAGREAVGVDISTLAEFVSGVKCTVFSEAELDKLEWWRRHLGRHSSTLGRLYCIRRTGLLQASQSSIAVAAAKGYRSIARVRHQTWDASA